MLRIIFDNGSIIRNKPLDALKIFMAIFAKYGQKRTSHEYQFHRKTRKIH